MGQRANMVIKKGGDWHLYYDHWCANRLDVELFWGPTIATQFVKQREPMDKNNGWLNEVWCEGAAIIDHDQKHLLWFGGEDLMYRVPMRRAYLDLMQRQWPDWTIAWAKGGIVELGAYLGLPADFFLDKDGPSYDDQFTQDAEDPEYNELLLTLEMNGRKSATRIAGDEVALGLGPVQLDWFKEITSQETLHWKGDMPTGGLHLDVDTNKLFYWFAQPTSALEARIQEAWNGWDCTYWGDHFEGHLELAKPVAIQLPLSDIKKIQRELLDGLRRGYHQEASNPALDIANSMEEAEKVEISPYTFEARGSYGDKRTKLKILGSLESTLPSQPIKNRFLRWIKRIFK